MPKHTPGVRERIRKVMKLGAQKARQATGWPRWFRNDPRQFKPVPAPWTITDGEVEFRFTRGKLRITFQDLIAMLERMGCQTSLHYRFTETNPVVIKVPISPDALFNLVKDAAGPVEGNHAETNYHLMLDIDQSEYLPLETVSITRQVRPNA